MSRITTSGTHPTNNKTVEVAYGWDVVPGFTPGYFFQVFHPDDEDLTYVNEGFLEGISEDRLNELKERWKVIQ